MKRNPILHYTVSLRVASVRTGNRDRESGMALLETAITLPLLLLVLFGIFEVGLAFARAQVLANAAREGAREASLFRPECRTGEVTAGATRVTRETGARLGMASGAIQVNLANVCVANQRVEVSVEYAHQLPVVSRLAALVGGSSLASNLTLRAQARMLNEIR
jgi:Flp pilus assembly protein TadG